MSNMDVDWMGHEGWRAVELPEPPDNMFLSLEERNATAVYREPSKKRLRLGPGARTISKFFAEFKLLNTVGTGSFGTVLKVISRQDGCTYAVKRLSKKSESLK